MLAALRYLFFVCFFALISLNSFATTEPYENFIKGSLKKGDSLIVKDEKFKNPSFNWSLITNINVVNNIGLKILEDQSIDKSFSCHMKVRVEYFSSPEQELPTIDTAQLNVNYDKTLGAKYHFESNYKFNNAFQIKVKILEVTSPEYGDQIPPVLQLKASIMIERTYAFNPSQFMGISGQLSSSSKQKGAAQRIYNGGVNNTNNQLEISWSLFYGATEYDVEWLTVDETSEFEILANQALANDYGLESRLDELFRNNATRITTPKLDYSISLIYNTKYILVRIRGVKYNAEGLRDEGDWNYKKEADDEYAIWPVETWHEENLNWQYAVSFAEEGKKKEVISYLDGTLRNRQTVTINNSDNFAIVQENVYDKYGRVAASILPAPTKTETSLTESLHYFPKFNKVDANNAFTSANLAINAADCYPSPQALNDNYGAANYYSNKNPLLANASYLSTHNYTRYIPDAGGYPLSITQYTPDNTGKVKVQGGVGSTFQPKNSENHTTRYYYGKPDQWELDKLFGNDVGFAEHYLKNVVIDPNGQASVNYVSPSGKTIATALAGSVPNNVTELEKRGNPQEMVVPILKPSQFTYSSTEKKLSATATYIITNAPSPVSLTYDIEELISHYPGGNFDMCSNCYYKVKISVKRDCEPQIVHETTEVRFGSKDSQCTFTKTPSGKIDLNLTEIGEYYITFEFALDDEVIERYTDKYITDGTNQGHLKSKEDFLKYYLSGANFADCFNDCKTALANLGTETQFKTMFNEQLATYGLDPNQFASALTTIYQSTLTKVQNFIAENCGPGQIPSPCESFKRSMLTDVSPGGQYAPLDANGAFIEPTINVISINFHAGAFPTTVGKTDARYINTTITREDNVQISPYDPNFSITDLVKYWQDSWAEEFLRFHPEYCKLQFCNDNVASALWDERLRETNKSADVLAAAGVSWTPDNATWLLAQDPFFKADASGKYAYYAMLYELENYSSSFSGSTLPAKNISDFSLYQIYCSSDDGTANQTLPADWTNCTPKLECRVADREWQSYRDLYLSLKLKYFQSVRRTTRCINSCEVGAPVSLFPSTSCSETLALDESGVQLGENQFQETNYYANIQSTYYFVAGSSSTIPLSPSPCGSAVEPVFYPCIKVQVPGLAAPVLFSNVWKFTCQTTLFTPCDLNFYVTVDGSIAVDTYVQYAGSGTYTYTIVAGDPNLQPVIYCNGDDAGLDFYTCFTIHAPGYVLTYQNVWVRVCYSNGGMYYRRSSVNCNIPEEFKSAFEINHVDNTAITDCDRYTQLMENKASNEKILIATYDQTIYSILPSGASINSKKPTTPTTKSGFDPYVLKEQFVIKTGTKKVGLYKNVWVAAYVPDSSSAKGKQLRIIQKMSTTAREKSLSGKPGSFTAQSFTLNSAPCLSFSNDVFSSSTTICNGVSKTNVNKRITIYLHDASGNPVAATSTIKVSALFYSQNFYPVVYSSGIIDLIIPVGQSSAYYEYESIKYHPGAWDDSGCWTNEAYFSCVQSITGADFCDYIDMCPGQPIQCTPALALKESRFEPNIPVDISTALNTNQLTQETTAEFQSTLTEIVNENVNIWMKDLETGLAGKDQNDINLLRVKLRDLALAAGDLKHPSGASSLPPGHAGIMVNGHACMNFGDVIRYIFHPTSATFSDTLNPYLINSIYPYGVIVQGSEAVTDYTSPIICDILSTLRQPVPTLNDAQFYSYLQNTFGSAMTLSFDDFAVLLKGCGNCKFVLQKSIELPVFLVPGAKGCITKAEFEDAKNALNSQFSSSLSSSGNYQTIFTNYFNQKFGFAFMFEDYQPIMTTSNGNAKLCHEPPSPSMAINRYACIYTIINVAFSNAMRDYDVYIQQKRTDFKDAYISTCSAAKANAELKVTQHLYHYTLYYYDRSGNLVRTVPPEGVATLEKSEITLAGKARIADLGSCTINDGNAIVDQTLALQKLSDVLDNGGNNAVEMWIHSDNSQGRQFIAATPDMKYMFQACLNGSLISVDVYKLSQTGTTNVSFILSNHVTANIASISPLVPWTHLVIQGANLSAGALQIWVNGLQYPPVAGAPSAGCAWNVTGNPDIVMPTNLGTLKHLRLYSGRLMSAYEIAENAASPCFRATELNALSWYKFNLPQPGGPTTTGPGSVVETQFNMIYPTHTLTTTYAYNSLNQVIQQFTPDAETSRFWYDDKGRLAISQNAKQQPETKYSYTDYDILGRITEVGLSQLSSTSSYKLVDPGFITDQQRKNIIIYGSRSEITQTVYDTKPALTLGLQNVEQYNLRKRVAVSLYREAPTASDINATYYNYDYTGNVKTLYQQLTGLPEIKRLDYEYDLHSGKVNFLAYQHDPSGLAKPDQFYYQYAYDAENRLVEASSGTLANVKAVGFGSSILASNRKVDAAYRYYLHGPLARLELGDNGHRVQGTYYAYTLQGWVKMVNGTSLNDPGRDMGADGADVAKDALAYSLGYYNNDYAPIAPAQASMFHVYDDTRNRGLYNGNITNGTYAIGGIDNGSTIGYTYDYDQLNRLKELWQHPNISTGWNFGTTNKKNLEKFSFDGNGNILTLQRLKPDGTMMDNLSYSYTYQDTRLVSNRLNAVHDGVPSATVGDVTSSSYEYDNIGNLKNDVSSGITGVSWNVYGKIKQITKSTSSGNMIGYTYDASGNRVTKKVGTSTSGTTTWYVRDAQGNALAVYDNAGNTMNLREQQLYGSSRLGMWKPDANLALTTSVAEWENTGGKFFELSNHLGNVMAVVSDVRIPDGSSWKPTIVSSNDYYAYGSQMPGRSSSLNNGVYRYGFNGKENDNEVKGEGNQQDYGMRIYDPRIGRFLSTDPLADDYPWYTPYQFAGNDVINNIDLDGGEPKKPEIPGTRYEGEPAVTSETRTGLHQISTTTTQLWRFHEGGVNGSIRGWMTEDSYYEGILKPLAEAENAGDWKSKYDFAISRSGQAASNYMSMINSVAANLKANPTYDSWKKWIPIWGSYKQAELDFGAGNNWSGGFNTLMTAADAFLVKSIVQAPMKAIISKGFLAGSTKYFGIGMSHEFGSSVARWGRLGLDMSGYKHHWLISQELMETSPWLKSIGNQTWNLTRFSTQASHMRWAHGQMYLGKSYPFTSLLYPITSTPSWFKFGLVPYIGGRTIN